MSLNYWLVGLCGIALGLALAAGLAWLRRQVRHGLAQLADSVAARVTEANRRADEMAPLLFSDADAKRHKEHWGVLATTERATDILVKLVEDAQVLNARAENALLLAEFIHKGGNPKAPWPEIVRWKQQQKTAANGQ